MKVSRIQIKDFNQFKDIDIDLTYPKGHEKAGQPLEKVCFIGQSGTGKTTLLKILGLYIGDKELNQLLFSKLFHNTFITFKFKDNKGSWVDYLESFGKKNNGDPFFHLKNADNLTFLDKEKIDKITEFEKKINLKLINFPANLRYRRKDIVIANDNDIIKKGIIDFEIDNVSEVWDLILHNIIIYRETIVSLKNQISDLAIADEKGFYKEDLFNKINDYNEWLKNNPNPIDEIANNCIDKLLEPFHLRVKREFEFSKKEDLEFIKIEDFNGNEVPFDLWSTGTRQILYSALPLYLLKPKDTIILFDEPERSLYPDMQRMIIDYYTSLTQDSQFFYATHSPIIASSFEPWEIVELKLDEKGNVYQDKYYDEKKERHLDNYTIFPQYLNYDLMLSNVFDLKETHNPIRNEKITEVLMLKNYLLKLKNEKKVDTPEFKDRYKDFKQLAVQLAWDFELF